MNIPEDAIEAAARALYARHAHNNELGVGWDKLPQLSVAYWRGQAAAALEAAAPFLMVRVTELIRDLTDPDGCEFDHNGSCQAHGYFYPRPGEKCPQQEAKDWAETVGGAE